MTLISCTLNYGKPIIVGDVLISREEKTNTFIPPTIHANVIDYITPEEGYPILYNQKVYILKDNIAIALAGDVVEMKTFLEKLKRLLNSTDIVNEYEEVITRFIDEYGLENNFSESAYYILIMKDEIDSTCNYAELKHPVEYWETIPNELFEKTIAIGTGMEDYITQCQASAQTIMKYERGNLNNAISLNISLIARLLIAERVSLHTIHYAWGGGFELIKFDNGKFVKMTNIAFLLYEFEDVESISSENLIPSCIIFQDYTEHFLRLQSFEINKDRNSPINFNQFTIKSFSKRDYHIPSIDNDVSSYMCTSLSDTSTKTNTIGVGISIKNEGGFFAPSFYVESNHLEIKITKQTITIEKYGLLIPYFSKIKNGYKMMK